MQAHETWLARFKQAQAATIRALAGDPRVALGFVQGGQARQDAPGQIALPAAEPAGSARDAIRGAGDLIALRHRFHDARLHARCAPRGNPARNLFDWLEEARIAALGARMLAGVAVNLDAELEARCRRAFLDTVTHRDGAPLDVALGLLVRERLSGRMLPPAARNVAAFWRDDVDARAGVALRELDGHLLDQAGFGAGALRLLAALGLLHEGAELGSPRATGGQDEANERGAPAATPQPHDVGHLLDEPARSGKSEGVAGAGAGAGADADADAVAGASASASADAVSGIGADAAAGTGASTSTDADAVAGADAGAGAGADADADAERHRGKTLLAPGGRPHRVPVTLAAASGYRIFTREFDRTVHADALAEGDELTYLRRQLDGQLGKLRRSTLRHASRLQRQLLARQSVDWTGGLEEGLLDPARLAAVVTRSQHAAAFRQARDTPVPDTVLTLLIDCSGSMRGHPIAVAALCADIVAQTMQRCRIRVEVLGFTTQDWRGGRARRRWLAQGQPPQPGRLNDLLHVIYKQADEPWRRARRRLGMLLKDEVLKENIDGEALLWAHERVLARPERRRILMVISDGMPMDTATHQANGSDYLARHLARTVDVIERHSPVELVAIGIGHDVGRFYRRAVTIRGVDQLGGAIFGELAALFDAPTRRRATRGDGAPA